jgi:hypothetical protein
MRAETIIKVVVVAAAMFALSVLCGTADARGFSREELLVSTKPMGQQFMKLLAAEPREALPRGTALRIERMFIHVLQEAKRLRPCAQEWTRAQNLVCLD